jgi:hypothetical protein
MEDHPWGRVVENYEGRVEEEDICKGPSKWLILVEPKNFQSNYRIASSLSMKFPHEKLHSST